MWAQKTCSDGTFRFPQPCNPNENQCSARLKKNSCGDRMRWLATGVRQQMGLEFKQRNKEELNSCVKQHLPRPTFSPAGGIDLEPNCKIHVTDASLRFATFLEGRIDCWVRRLIDSLRLTQSTCWFSRTGKNFLWIFDWLRETRGGFSRPPSPAPPALNFNPQVHFFFFVDWNKIWQFFKCYFI